MSISTDKNLDCAVSKTHFFVSLKSRWALPPHDSPLVEVTLQLKTPHNSIIIEPSHTHLSGVTILGCFVATALAGGMGLDCC